MVQPWGNAPEGSGPQWECTVTAPAIDVLVPPGQTYSQWMELWRGGGCVRRCDGRREMLTDSPCMCPDNPKERTALAAKGEACKPTTRLNVMLPKVPDIGVWRLETHSYYAAVELAGTADVLRKATEAGYPLPAQLRIDQRHVKRPGEGRKDFPVVALELPQSLSGQLLARAADMPAIGPGPASPMLGAGRLSDIPHAPEPRGAEAAALSAATGERDESAAAPIVATEDGRTVDAGGVIAAETAAPVSVPTREEIFEAADAKLIDINKLVASLFPDRGRGVLLTGDQLVTLMAAIAAAPEPF